MAQVVTKTFRFTSSQSSHRVCNGSYMSSGSGIIQIAETVLGAVCLGLVGFYGNRYYYDLGAQAAEWINLFLSKDQLDVWKPVMFFMLVVTTFLLNTLCVLLSCVLSFNTATFMSKTVYGVLYNFMAFALYLPSSITLILSIKKREIQSYKEGYYYDPFMAAGILGTIISVLYFLGTILSYRSYRGTL